MYPERFVKLERFRRDISNANFFVVPPPRPPLFWKKSTLELFSGVSVSCVMHGINVETLTASPGRQIPKHTTNPV